MAQIIDDIDGVNTVTPAPDPTQFAGGSFLVTAIHQLAVNNQATANSLSSLSTSVLNKLDKSGDGSALTGITKAQVGLGNVVNVDTTNANNITNGTLSLSLFPDLSATYLKLSAGGTVSNPLAVGKSFGNAGQAAATTLLSVGSNFGSVVIGGYGNITANTATFSSSISAGSFSGIGTNLTALNGTNVTLGTVVDARLSSNVALKNASNTFTVDQTISGTLLANKHYSRAQNWGEFGSYSSNGFNGLSVGSIDSGEETNLWVGGNVIAYCYPSEIDLDCDLYANYVSLSTLDSWGSINAYGQLYSYSGFYASSGVDVYGTANFYNDFSTAQGVQTHSCLLQASDIFGDSFCSSRGMGATTSGRVITFPSNQWAYVRGKRVYIASSQSITIPASTSGYVWLDTDGLFHYASGSWTDASNGRAVGTIVTSSTAITTWYPYLSLNPAFQFGTVGSAPLTLPSATWTMDDYSGNATALIWNGFNVVSQSAGWKKLSIGNYGGGLGLTIDKTSSGTISLYRNSVNQWQSDVTMTAPNFVLPDATSGFFGVNGDGGTTYINLDPTEYNESISFICPGNTPLWASASEVDINASLYVNGSSNFYGGLVANDEFDAYGQSYFYGQCHNYSSTVWQTSYETLVVDPTNHGTIQYFRPGAYGYALAQGNFGGTNGEGATVSLTNITAGPYTATYGIHLGSGGNVGIGVIPDGNYKLSVSGNVAIAGTLKIASSAPASSSATGTAGTYTWDSSYLYVCTATNTWKRASLSTW